MAYAFIFPGQGSQYVGMGKALADRYPEAARTFSEADEALGRKLSTLIFEGPSEELTLTWNTQPAIVAASVAAYRALAAQTSLAPVAMAGHSLGEYSALVAAGAISFADAVKTVEKRGQFMQEAVPVGEGAMYAVLGLDNDKLRQLCVEESTGGEVVELANDNCPGQAVISGSASAAGRVAERAKELGAKRAVALNVSAPFHCRLMAPAAKRLAEVLAGVDTAVPACPVAANVDGALHKEADTVRERLVKQVSGAVLWQDCVRALAGVGATTLVEIGPGKVLSGLTRRIDRALGSANIEDPASLQAFVEGLENV